LDNLLYHSINDTNIHDDDDDDDDDDNIIIIIIIIIVNINLFQFLVEENENFQKEKLQEDYNDAYLCLFCVCI